MHERVCWILCGQVPETNPPCKQPEVHRLSVYGPGANVYVSYATLTELFWGKVPPRLLDLLTIAAYVYSADQAAPRGKQVRREYGDGWRRRFFFRIEVQEAPFWEAPEVQHSLVALLSFLTDDSYRFEFVASQRERYWQPSVDLEFNDCALPDFDEVMLFSGGLDSLAGAVHLGHVLRRSAVWIKHESNPKFAEQHRRLATELGRRLRPRMSHYVPVKVNKDSDLTIEPIQRSRSFLFGTIALVLAAYLNRPRILFFENGVVSLNLPYATQVVGARATRTTHPRVLCGMTQLFSQVLERPLLVENLFATCTKTEGVLTLERHGYGDLIQQTTSCAHPRLATRDKPHCGVCSQCIDRRFAVLAAKAQQHDPMDHYAVELLRGSRPNALDQTMVAAYVESALQMAQMSEGEFLGRYGEAARAFRYGQADALQNARMLYDLHARHGHAICGVMRQIIRDNPDPILFGTTPSNSLLGMIPGDAEPVPHTPPSMDDPRSNEAYVFQKCGEGWWIRYQNRHGFFLPHKLGLAYLCCLLSSPRKALTTAQLQYLVARDPRLMAGSDSKADTNKETYEYFAAWLQENEDAIVAARKANDLALVDRLDADRAQVAAELQRLFDERKRPEVTLDNKRAYKRVAKAINAALEKIAKHDLLLHEHLTGPALQQGYTWYYTPPDDVKWVT